MVGPLAGLGALGGGELRQPPPHGPVIPFIHLGGGGQGRKGKPTESACRTSGSISSRVPHAGLYSGFLQPRGSWKRGGSLESVRVYTR